jgi:Holliday junction resolvase RusA-like endonuclease
MLLTAFTRAGRPRTKGSLRATCTRVPAHKVRYQEETRDSGLWRKQMAKAAQVAHLKATDGILANWRGPVEVKATFVFARTMSAGGGPIPSHDTPYPTDIHLGDVDKLTRNLLDALTDSHVIADDSYVVTITCHKRWAGPGEEPGVIVAVEAL